jgi:hypothetical protein
MDVGQHTSRGNGDTSEQFVQFLIVLHSEGDVTGNDTCLLVVTGGIAGKFENFSTEVFKYGGKVDWGTLWYWNRKYFALLDVIKV